MKRMMLIVALILWALCLPVRASATEGELAVGGIHILKTDVTGAPLEGASFQIYRHLRDGELTDNDVKKEVLKIEGENRIMTQESFWTIRNMTGQKQWSVTSDKNGQAAVYGLSYGTYYLVETDAPSGYNRILEPIRIAIHKYSHLTAADQVRDDQGVAIDNTVQIINVRYLLPDTGNFGAIQLAAGGTGVLFSSAALLLLNRKRWK